MGASGCTPYHYQSDRTRPNHLRAHRVNKRDSTETDRYRQGEARPAGTTPNEVTS
jgi:hypothetical protein